MGKTALAIAVAQARPPGKRIAALDVARGVAIAAMIVYHFAWDLWAFGLIATDVGYGFWWRLFAHTIATSFLAIVGIGLVLAARDGFNRAAFLRRLAMIGAGAVGVSIVTWFTDAGTFVYFGILHLIAVGSVLAVPFLALPAWASAVAAVIVIAFGNAFFTPLLDPAWLAWIGFAVEPQPTVDYYPIFPWFGALLAGVAIGRFALENGLDRSAAAWRPQDPVTRLLGLAGRWSLVIYLVHQLVLFGGVSLAAHFLPRGPVAVADPGAAYMNECLPLCAAIGRDPASCTTYCGCMYAGITGTDLQSTPPDRLSDDQRARIRDRAGMCAALIPPR